MTEQLHQKLVEKAAGVRFKAETGFFGATTMGVGALLGAGIYVLVGVAVAKAGAGVWLAYVICGGLTLLTVSVYGALAKEKTASGGGYYYAYDELGSFWGFMVGWHLAAGSIFACALYAYGFASYALPFVVGDAPSLLLVKVVAAAIIVLLAGLALPGGKGGARIGTIFTWGNVAILMIIAAIGFFNFKSAHFSPLLPRGMGGVGSAISVIYISFFGFQLVANSSEEIKNAKRTVPLAMMAALVISAAVYLVVVVAAVGSKGASSLANSAAPLLEVASQVPGPVMIYLVGIGGVLASVAALNSTLVSQSRQLFAMGRDGMLPKLLGAVIKNTGVPAAAVLVGGVLALLAVLMLDLSFLAESANFALLFSMLPVCVALVVLQRKRAVRRWSWKWLLPYLALVANVGLLFTLSTHALFFGGMLAGIGCGVFLGYARTGEQRGRAGMSVSFDDRQGSISLLTGANRVLLPLGNPETFGPLYNIACSVLPPQGGEVVALSVATGPENTMPRVMLQDRQFTDPALAAVARIQALTDGGTVPVRPVLRASRNLSDGIRHAALEENCSLIVMGWTPRSLGRPSELLVDVVSKTRTDFVFAHLVDQRPFKRIGVALGSVENLVFMSRIAGRLAETCAGSVTYFSVLPNNYSAGDLARAKSIQTSAIEQHAGAALYQTELFTTDNPLEAIVSRSQNLDLLLIGSASSKERGADELVGSFSTMIIEQAHCSVLVVRRTPGFGRIVPPRIAELFTFDG